MLRNWKSLNAPRENGYGNRRRDSLPRKKRIFEAEACFDDAPLDSPTIIATLVKRWNGEKYSLFHQLSAISAAQLAIGISLFHGEYITEKGIT